MNLLISLRSEMLKTKRTATFYFTIIAAALVPLVFLLDATFGEIQSENRKDALNGVYAAGSQALGMLIFPMFIVLLCTMLAQIEYRNNAWKQVFASPQPLSNIFLARFLNVHLLILLFLVLYNVLLLITVVAVHYIDPALNLLNQPLDVNKVITKNVNMYIAVLALSALQFWIGLRFRNFIIPVAIGFALWVAGSILVFEMKSKMAPYYPYSFLPITIFPGDGKLLPTVQWSSVGYTVLFLALGFIDFRQKRK